MIIALATIGGIGVLGALFYLSVWLNGEVIIKDVRDGLVNCNQCGLLAAQSDSMAIHQGTTSTQLCKSCWNNYPKKAKE